jgi:hypothetical protein
MAYLLWKALPKPFDSIHLLHCIGARTGCQSKFLVFQPAFRETLPRGALSEYCLGLGIKKFLLLYRIRFYLVYRLQSGAGVGWVLSLAWTTHPLPWR